MKIIIVTTISSTVNAFLIPHINMLVKNGYKVDIACNMVDQLDPVLIDLGCEVHEIMFSRNPLAVSNITAYKNLKRVLLEGEYDILHTHTPIASAVSRFAAMKMEGLRVIYTAHGFHFHNNAPLINWAIYYPLEKFLSKFTDDLIVINNEDYSRAKKAFRMKRIFHINGVGVSEDLFNNENNIDILSIRNQFNLEITDFVVVVVGELNNNKNQEIVIKSIIKLSKKYNNIKLILVGSGKNKEKYESMISGYEHIIHLAGFQKNIPEIMKSSNLLVSASKREGLPVNVIEGMLSGLPVILSHCRGNIDLVQNGINGYIFDVNNQLDLESKIESLYLNEKLRESFSTESTDSSSKFTLDEVLPELLSVYQNELN